MYVIFLGPPGVGKGTQAAIIAERAGWAHISTGDMLRTAAREGSELGLMAKQIMEEGGLVGDEVMIDPSTSCGACDACLRGEVPFCRRFRIVGEHRWGTHAEAVVVPAVKVVPKPASVSWEQAAASGLAVSSAVRMARPGGLAEGDGVLVVGGGGGSATAARRVAQALEERTRE